MGNVFDRLFGRGEKTAPAARDAQPQPAEAVAAPESKTTPPDDSAATDAADPAPDGDPVKDTPASKPPESLLKKMNAYWLGKERTAPATNSLSPQVVQSVQLVNAETADQAPLQITTAPNMMIGQASGLVAQSAAAYFDGMSRITMATQAVLMKDMAEKLAKSPPDVVPALEDAAGSLIAELLLGGAAAITAAAGAMEGEAAGFAIDKIDKSIGSYTDLMKQLAKTPA